MLKVAYGKLKVGERTYLGGEVLSPEDEAVLRSRPAFGVLLEDGNVVEIEVPAEKNENVAEPEQEDVEETQTEDEQADDFSCSFCDFVGKNERSLAMHVRRAHPDEE